MKINFSLLLATLTGLLTCDLQADDDAKAALAKLAGAKRDAVLQLTVGKALEDQNARSFGVFISHNGLALVDLQALATKQKPTIVIAGGTTVELGKILKVFPEQELALMKFDHLPKRWLELASVEPALNEVIALVTLNTDNPWDATIPPVVGPVMAKRSGTTSNSQVVLFTRVLSLGSGLSTAQRAGLGPGRFAIDSKGQLVAFTNGTKSDARQTLIQLAPVVGLKDQIDTLAKAGKEIMFPLPESSNPLDPAAFDPDYHPMNVAFERQDWPEFQRLLEKLRLRFPKSHALRARSAFLRHPAIQRELQARPNDDPLLDFPEPQPDDPVAQQVRMWSARADFFSTSQRFEDAIRARKAAIKLSPEDYSADRVLLAHLYAHLGRIDEAMKLYQEAYSSLSDSLVFVEMFELLMTREGKLGEVEKLTNRVYELERVYRRW